MGGVENQAFEQSADLRIMCARVASARRQIYRYVPRAILRLLQRCHPAGSISSSSPPMPKWDGRCQEYRRSLDPVARNARRTDSDHGMVAASAASIMASIYAPLCWHGEEGQDRPGSLISGYSRQMKSIEKIAEIIVAIAHCDSAGPRATTPVQPLAFISTVALRESGISAEVESNIRRSAGQRYAPPHRCLPILSVLSEETTGPLRTISSGNPPDAPLSFPAFSRFQARRRGAFESTGGQIFFGRKPRWRLASQGSIRAQAPPASKAAQQFIRHGARFMPAEARSSRGTGRSSYLARGRAGAPGCDRAKSFSMQVPAGNGVWVGNSAWKT